MKVLWYIGHTRKQEIRTGCIGKNVETTPIEEEMVESQIRLFGHVMRRPSEAPIIIGHMEEYTINRDTRRSAKVNNAKGMLSKRLTGEKGMQPFTYLSDF